MAFDLTPAARLLFDTWRDRRPVAPLPDRIAPHTEAEGAAVQFALAGLMGATRPAGFKIGATGQRMQAYLGVDAPVAGFMRDSDVHHRSAELDFAGFIKPGLECEIAVRLAHDLPPAACTRDQAQAAIGEVFAAIEIVENRYGDLKALGTPTLLADRMYHAAAVTGDPIAPEGIDLAALHGEIRLADGTTDHGVGADLLGHPLNGLALLAASPLAHAFGGLRAGQIVLLGSVTPPIWLSGPMAATVRFGTLAPVTVRLS